MSFGASAPFNSKLVKFGRRVYSSDTSIRVHIETARGERKLSGKMIDKDSQTHIAKIQLDNSSQIAIIDLSNYACRGTELMPNTLYYRRVPSNKDSAHAGA